jgi:hypothetical protein
MIQLLQAQSKKIDAIQEKLDSSSKPDNQKLNDNEQKTNGMNSHSNNEATNQQLNYKQIGELQILIEIIIDKLEKLEYVFFKFINFNQIFFSISRKFSDFQKNEKIQSEETKPSFVDPRNLIPGRSNSNKKSIIGIFTRYLKFIKQLFYYMI